MNREPHFDLRGYLDRIRFGAVPPPDLPSLEALHVHHLEHIPFENIDVWLGRPGSLELEALQAKMVRSRRGGYCFEQNTLFAAALRALGYQVHTLEARVRPPGVTAPRPRAHMLLRVDIDDRAFLADVGFGGDGPVVPVPLDGAACVQHEGVYRVDREDRDLHVLRLLRNGQWRDLYAFTLTPAEAVDYEVAHHFTSTHPRSPFVQTLTVQRAELRARHILRDRCYTVRKDGQERARIIGDEEMASVLDERFALPLDQDLLLEIARALGPPPRA